MANDFQFQRFQVDEDPDFLNQCEQAAREKLETLYPTKRIKAIDPYSITIESDSLYATDGYETYLIGMIDEEVPALQRTTDGQIFTFRV